MVALEIDPNAVAVRMQNSADALNRVGRIPSFDPSRFREVPALSQSWVKLVPAKGTTFVSAREIADELIRNGATFVSPVIIDSRGYDSYVTEVIFLALPYKMDPEEKHRILSGVKGQTKFKLSSSPVRLLKRPLPPGAPPNIKPGDYLIGDADGREMYSIEVSLANGWDILEEVERLRAIDGVAWAEPDYIMVMDVF